MNSIRRWITLSLALAALIAGGVIFRAFLLQNVIMPASLVIWAIVRVFRSIPQEAYWVGLVFIAFVLGLRLLPMSSAAIKVKEEIDTRQPARRYEYWCKIIDDSSRSRENKSILKDNLCELLIGVIAQEEDRLPNAVRDDLIHKRLELPPEIYAYLDSSETGKDRHYFKQWFAQLTSIGGSIQKNVTSGGQSMADLLTYLETYVEIDNDSDHA